MRARPHQLARILAVTIACVLGSAAAVQAAWRSAVIRPPENQDAQRAVVSAVAVNSDGSLLAAAGDDHQVYVWNAASHELDHRLEGHADWVRAVAFSASDSILATAGNDRQILLWNPRTGDRLRRLATHPEAVVAMSFTPDGKHLVAVGFESQLRVYQVADGKVERSLKCPCRDMRSVTVDPSGKRFAAAGRNGRIRIWRLADGEQVATVNAHRQRIRSLRYIDDERLVSAGEDGVVRLWDADGQLIRALPRQPAKLMCLAPCGDDLLAVGGSDNLIRLFRLTTGEQEQPLTEHVGTIAALAYAGGRLVSGSFDTTIRIWTPTERVAVDQPDRPRGENGSGVAGVTVPEN